MQKRNWWNLAESIAIVATIVGSVGAEIFRQSLLLSAPLSATLLLNLLNRRQANETMQKQVDSNISQLRRDFYQLDQYVLESLKAINQQTGIQITPPEPIYPVKVTLEPPLEMTLRETHQPRLYDRQPLISTSNVEQASLTAAEERSLAPLLMMQAQLLQLNQRVEQLTSQAPSEELETQIAALNTTVQSLEQRTNVLPPVKEVAATIAAIKTLYQRQSNLEKNIAQLIQQEIRAELAALPDGEIHGMKAAIAQLNAEVMSLKQQSNGMGNDQSINGQLANALNGQPISSQLINGQLTNGKSEDTVALAAQPTVPPTQESVASEAKQRFEDLATAIVQLEKDMDNPALKKHLTLLASALYTASVKSQS